MPLGTPRQDFHFGGFTLDLRKGMLLRADEPVLLRPKAYALLAHLARNIGGVVSKSELMDVVWPGVTVTEDSLTQCIREIRKALGDERQDIVRTISRRGYMLAARADADGGFAGQPTVAILRFRNETDDPAQTPIVDGFAEDILNDLARFRTVTVLGRNSSFAVQRDSSLDARAIGERLGADYLVEGAIRRSEKRLQVTVRLLDAPGDLQLWSERYEAEGTEIFAVQDEIAHQIVNRLVARLEDAGLHRSARKPPASLAAYELLLRGVARLRGYAPEDNENAKLLFEAAIEKDPDYGLAHAYLALSRVILGGYALASPTVLADALHLACKSVTLDPEEPRCHRILTIVRLYLRQHEPAERHIRRSLELNPYDADTVAQMGYLLTMRGRPLDGLAWMDRAVRLNPLHPEWYHYDRSMALYSIGEYRAAAEALERLPILRPWTRARLAACYAQLGELETARRHLAAANQIDPSFSPLNYARNGVAFENPADIERLVQGITVALAP